MRVEGTPARSPRTSRATMARLPLFYASLTCVTQITARTWEILLSRTASSGRKAGLRGEKMQAWQALAEVMRRGRSIPSEVSKPMPPTYSNRGLFCPREKQLCLCPATASELISPNNLPSYKALNLIVVPQVVPTLTGSKRWRTSFFSTAQPIMWGNSQREFGDSPPPLRVGGTGLQVDGLLLDQLPSSLDVPELSVRLPHTET